ncbi:hypothetical protein [Actinocrispum sp. NPDC049592]|uniref:hypothetical protein n=1 Tax=Actinocrispum sp. NPDC049592 TaxID=3154835 RepID=UPI0034156DAA
MLRFAGKIEVAESVAARMSTGMRTWPGRVRAGGDEPAVFNALGAVGKLGERHEPESHLIPLVLQVAAMS